MRNSVGEQKILFLAAVFPVSASLLCSDGWRLWITLRAGGSPQIRWCNSCGNLGESEFGAPACVAMVEAGGGDIVPPEGLRHLDMSNYWDSEVQGSRLVLTNSDEEALCLNSDGSFVWLSHPSMNKAVSVTVSARARDRYGHPLRRPLHTS